MGIWHSMTTGSIASIKWCCSFLIRRHCCSRTGLSIYEYFIYHVGIWEHMTKTLYLSQSYVYRSVDHPDEDHARRVIEFYTVCLISLKDFKVICCSYGYWCATRLMWLPTLWLRIMLLRIFYDLKPTSWEGGHVNWEIYFVPQYRSMHVSNSVSHNRRTCPKLNE